MQKSLLFAGLACLLLAAFEAPTVEETPRPNIVFILVDDLGYGDLGSYGQERINTPHLDRLAQEGMRFTDHYAGSTVCGPSRATLMTGLHAGHSPIRGNPRWNNSGKPVDLAPRDVTVAELLQDTGYYTGIIGKWGLAESEEGFLPAMPTQQGFSVIYEDLYQHQQDRYGSTQSQWSQPQVAGTE